MFCFTMLGSCARSIYIFGIDWQSTLQVQQKLISRLPVESYVQLRCYCCGRILGQLSGYWATQELCKNVNFDMETKAKKLNCLSSYQGLNGSSLGQISELLRLRKESYCNVKLKCLDTGQHTVLLVKSEKLVGRRRSLSSCVKSILPILETFEVFFTRHHERTSPKLFL